jgi:hypothetical protein
MTAARNGARARRRRTWWLASALVGAVALAGCGDRPGGTPRPTDPRQILVGAVGATAALPALRLHAEVVANVGGLVGAADAAMTMAFDADVDLATRQFAGRQTTQMPRNLGGNGIAMQQVSDVIVTTTATFNRDSQTGRWQKFPAGMGGGFGAGPTNAQIATAVAGFLSNPATTYELLDAAPCTLGTCDHILVHLDGPTLGVALAQLVGVPADQMGAQTIPSFNVDVLVDQATSVVSELRTEISMQGSSARILLSVSNPGQSVTIAPPPPALTDDFGANFGGLGPDPTTILGTVGDEVPTDNPAFPDPVAPDVSDPTSPSP